MLAIEDIRGHYASQKASRVSGQTLALHVVDPGFRRLVKTQLRHPRYKMHMGAVVAASKDKDWPALGVCKEWLTDPALADPHCSICGKHGGHVPLFVALSGLPPPQVGQEQAMSAQRARSDVEIAWRKVLMKKRCIYNKTGCWPWWIEHPSEAQYWSANSDYGMGTQGSAARQYDGLYWRLERHENPVVAGYKEELWIELYGQQAFEDALEGTERAFIEAIAKGLTLEQHRLNTPWRRGQSDQSPPPKGKGRGQSKGSGQSKGKGRGQSGRGCGQSGKGRGQSGRGHSSRERQAGGWSWSRGSWSRGSWSRGSW